MLFVWFFNALNAVDYMFLHEVAHLRSFKVCIPAGTA